jgi:hypothetical protein
MIIFVIQLQISEQDELNLNCEEFLRIPSGVFENLWFSPACTRDYPHMMILNGKWYKEKGCYHIYKIPAYNGNPNTTHRIMSK